MKIPSKSKGDAPAQKVKLKGYTCADKNEMRMRIHISFRYAHAHSHLISVCACAHHCACVYLFGMRILFWYARAHLTLICACATHFGMCVRISFWYVHHLSFLFLQLPPPSRRLLHGPVLQKGSSQNSIKFGKNAYMLVTHSFLARAAGLFLITTLVIQPTVLLATTIS